MRKQTMPNPLLPPIYLYDVPRRPWRRGTAFIPKLEPFLVEWPPGWIIVHNHVRPRGFPKVKIGRDGFRAWFAWPDASYVRCRCGWAPQLGTHYRVRRS
jgi:hypothetical protein